MLCFSVLTVNKKKKGHLIEIEGDRIGEKYATKNKG